MNEDLNSIMQKLADCTLDYSVSQIVGELSLVVERLGFAEFQLNHPELIAEDLAKIDFLLNRDVSSGVIEFVKFLVESNRLGVLLNEAGLMFVSYSHAHFAEMKQLTFKTAIELSAEKRKEIRVMLMRKYPVSTRILFEYDPLVVAGFSLHDSSGVICDYSMRHRMISLIEEYVKRKLPFPWAQTTT